MIRSISVFLLIYVLCISVMAQGKNSIINFGHLQHLTERIEFKGDSVDIVHIYADAPNYAWTDAGDEGIACVDDAARAAVDYLRYYDLTKDEIYLEKAKPILRFVMKMESEDGSFCNFIMHDHSVNTTGQTSYKSFGWWGVRGVWCMSVGYRLLRDRDPEFASLLKKGIERTFSHIDSLFLKYGRVQELKGYKTPQWLLYESGADVTSELLLGLCDYYRATNDKDVKKRIEKLAEGLMVMQDGDIKKSPHGLHRSWQTMWHMWGNGQTQALATAGKILHNERMIHSAEREANGFYSRLLIEGFMKELDVADSSKTLDYDQIAYGVRPMAAGLIRLYETTKNKNYLTMAGLAASWLFGNNPPGQIMYDTLTGRCFDGIRDSATVNKNSGAESTIEALHTLIELERYPTARKYYFYKRIRNESKRRYLYAVFEDRDRNELTLGLDLNKSNLFVYEGDESRKFNKRMGKE